MKKYNCNSQTARGWVNKFCSLISSQTEKKFLNSIAKFHIPLKFDIHNIEKAVSITENILQKTGESYFFKYSSQPNPYGKGIVIYISYDEYLSLDGTINENSKQNWDNIIKSIDKRFSKNNIAKGDIEPIGDVKVKDTNYIYFREEKGIHCNYVDIYAMPQFTLIEGAFHLGNNKTQFVEVDLNEVTTTPINNKMYSRVSKCNSSSIKKITSQLIKFISGEIHYTNHLDGSMGEKDLYIEANSHSYSFFYHGINPYNSASNSIDQLLKEVTTTSLKNQLVPCFKKVAKKISFALEKLEIDSTKFCIGDISPVIYQQIIIPAITKNINLNELFTNNCMVNKQVVHNIKEQFNDISNNFCSNQLMNDLFLASFRDRVQQSYLPIYQANLTANQLNDLYLDIKATGDLLHEDL
jgi:hypothetical protein